MKAKTMLAAAFTLAAVPASVSAATTITYAGIVYDRQGSGNQDQYFGSVIAGTTAYTLVYTINDQAGGAITHPDAYSIRLDGAGSVTAVMTINGISQTIAGASQSHAIATNGKPNLFNNPTDAIGQKSQDFIDDALVYRDVYAETMLSSYLSNFLASADYTSPFTYQLVGGDSFGSSFHINDLDKRTRVGSSIYLNLGMSTVTVATMPPPVTGGPVPEPATWMLMIGGFAIAGAAARRRPRAGVRFA